MAAEHAAVTTHDWIRGISLSVLASVIGGASKLSIRKSWIIDARRKAEISSSGAFEANRYVNQNHDSDDSSVENEANQLAPLEVDCSHLPPFDQHSTLLPRDPNRKHRRKKPSISAKQLSWHLYVSGMIGMSFLNPLCCVLAMRYANPSILAPFSGLTLVWIVLLSGITVGEHPGRSQKVACTLIVTGEVLVALFGDHMNGEDRDVDDVVSE
ncbi:hypothetical protein ACHAW5_007104 [Stephanodiscus triporus]|uniref:EamA domain-containing protein n=1 Tax=Stephanodiscus triporus TaxID=2934178 RepID=A0ABD3NPY7_9STRA